jgi:hypothetical protein
MMYRYRIFAPLRNRPLEAAGGLAAILRGLWAVLWPNDVHDQPVLDYIQAMMPVWAFGWIVLLAGLYQFRMAYVMAHSHTKRILPVYVQAVTIGILVFGYAWHDHRDVTLAFYLTMWWTQVWIWGDLHYAERHSA